MAEQVLLIVADPRDVPIGSQQHGRRVEVVADVREVVDALRPSLDREAAGLVEQESATAV